MSFLWGGREKFEKDDNTIRGVYKLNPSFGFIDKKKYFEVPVVISYSFSGSDNYPVSGGMLYSLTDKVLGSYTELFFGSESYGDSYKLLGDMIYGGMIVTKSSFIESRYFSYPYTGYKSDPYVIKGGIVYTLEVIE